MIKHIVIWTTNDDATLEQKTEMKDQLEALMGVVPELISIEVGIDEGNGTMSLFSEFKTMEDMDAYQKHPKHEAVVGLVRSLVCARVACDYTV